MKLETGLFLKDSSTHKTLSAAASLLFLHILLPWKWPSLISVVTGLHGPADQATTFGPMKLSSTFYTIHFDPFCIVDFCSLIWFFLMQPRSPRSQGNMHIPSLKKDSNEMTRQTSFSSVCLTQEAYGARIKGGPQVA